MLIHQLSGHMWGKFQEMQDDMENSEMLMKKIISLYEEHTKIPKKEINMERIQTVSELAKISGFIEVE